MSPNNKILVLSNSWIGLFSFRKEVYQAFIEHQYEVTIACPFDEPEKAKWFEDVGCKTINMKFNRQGTNPILDFKLMLRYRKLIKQVNPIAVLSYTIKPNLYGGMACALTKTPQIANVTGLGAAVEYPGIMQKITIMLYRLGLRKTYVTFFQNNENRQFCIKHKMVNTNTKLIPGSGVNLSYHQLKDFPSEADPIRFIFISRIRKEKGIDEYLEAAKVIKERYTSNVEFHVVGWCEGEYEATLKSLAEKGIVIYHGGQSDVRPFIEKVHCTIHPTFYPEGMSNVLLESCAAGRAIITTDRAGCREIVDDGVNGFVVRQQDATDLIEKVMRYVELPYCEKKKMGLNARKKVENEFDRKIVVDAYLKAVADL